MKSKIIFLVLILFLISIPSTVYSQFDIIGKVKRSVNRNVNNKVDDVINNKVNDILNPKKEKTDKNESQEKKEDKSINQSNENPAPFQSYSKFDFIPGEKVIFYDDFSQDAVGDFPALYNTNGSGEIVTTNLYPGNWLKYVMRESIWTDKLLTLPDNYTLEFDIIPIEGTEGGMGGWDFRLMKCINEKSWDGGAVPGNSGFSFGVEYYGRTYYRAYNNKLDGKFWDQSGYNEDKNTYEKKTRNTTFQFGCKKREFGFIRTKPKCLMFRAPFQILLKNLTGSDLKMELP